MADKIRELLKARGATVLPGAERDIESMHARKGLVKILADSYPSYNKFISDLLYSDRKEPVQMAASAGDATHRMLDVLCQAGYIKKLNGGYELANRSMQMYLTGLWFEEFVYHAVLQAGADAGLVGVVLQWQAKQYSGVSEIDVIARKGDRLLFVSCKTTKPDFQLSNQKHRNALIAHLHEADNIPDHFGASGDKVALIVTTDMIDEEQDNKPRYEKLFGLADVLRVELLTLEDIGWRQTVERFRKILEDM